MHALNGSRGTTPPTSPADRPGRALIEAALAAGLPALDEQAGKEFFAAYGLTVPPGANVTSADEAVRVATEIGYPVVMKGSSAQVQHKTDAGLVILGVQDEVEVREAYRTLEARAAAVGATLDGVLVEHMVKGKREFVAGLLHDRLFGPVVMFGLGGIYTEALGDVAFAVAPLGDGDAAELLEQIEARELLGAFRGLRRSTARRSIDVLQALGRMAADHPEIREIDVNPLLIDGSQPVAVDALIAIGEPVEVSTRAPADVSRLHSLLAPRSVAVVGASADTAKWGGMLIANLKLGGFPGAIYPINPKGRFDIRVPRVLERRRVAGDA